VTNLGWRPRPIFRQLWIRLLYATGCLWWAKRQLRRRGAAVVLTFHRVLNDHELQHTCSLPGMVIREETFEKLAGYVSGACQAMEFEQAVRTAAEGKVPMVFTFDDGWKDTQTNALPTALRYRIPLTVFLCPGLIGRALPFWPEQVTARLRSGSRPVPDDEIERSIEALKVQTPTRRREFMAGLGAVEAPACAKADRTASWDDILEMAAAGIRFGCHTHTHQILTTVSDNTARQEIRDGKRAIESELKVRCNLFAYPNGNTSQTTRQILTEEGFTAGFTTQRGFWTNACHPLAIPRVNICEENVVGCTGRFSTEMFQYTVFWRTWRAMRAERPVAAKPRPEPVLTEA